jgi:hypothetical protein
LKQFALLPGYHLETMKRLVKRINPAFTVVQPLPLWPLPMASTASYQVSDRQSDVPQPTAAPETIPVPLCCLPARSEFSHHTDAN